MVTLPRWTGAVGVAALLLTSAACSAGGPAGERGAATTGTSAPSASEPGSAPSTTTATTGPTSRPTSASSASTSSTTASTAPTTASTASATASATTSTTTSTTTTTVVAGQPPGLSREAGNLAPGVRGIRTRLLQRRLRELKFDPGSPDGDFGTKTAMAVWAFQALNGLARDGVVTPELEQRIHAAGPQPMLRPDLGPTHSEVDLDRQVLLVFEGGALELVTHVSTGSGRPYCENGHCGDAVTPTGDYRYQRRIPGWRTSPLGKLFNPIYFTGGIAVHGAPSVPGYPASHGCVRIPMHIAGYFPDLVANGEPISVFRAGPAPAG